MQSLISLFSKKIAVYTVLAVVVLGGGYYFYRSGGSKEETITVHPATFLQQISVSGKVIAAQNVDLGFSQSGRISHTYSKVGDTVGAGDLIAEMENGDLAAALETEKAKLQSLRQGTREEDIYVSQVDVQNSVNDVVNDIKNAYVVSDDAIRNKVDQLLSNPRGSNPQLNIVIPDSQLKSSVEINRPIFEGMFASWNTSIQNLSPNEDPTQYATEAKNNLRNTQLYLDKVAFAVNSLLASASVSQTTIDGYKTAISTARTNVTSALAALSASQDKLESNLSKLALKQAGSTESDILAQEARVRSAEASLIKTRIYAPFTGVITKMDAKVGQIISPNVSEITMISQGNFEIESYAPEVNVSLISKNNPAQVSLDAYGSEVLFPAKVISIDPAETMRDGVSTYKTVLEFLNQDSRIKSGMTANVTITTKEKTGVISVPQKIVTMKEGKKYVSVKEGRNIVDREVETGDISSSGQIEIIKGLSDGDTVILTPPAK